MNKKGAPPVPPRSFGTTDEAGYEIPVSPEPIYSQVNKKGAPSVPPKMPRLSKDTDRSQTHEDWAPGMFKPSRARTHEDWAPGMYTPKVAEEPIFGNLNTVRDAEARKKPKPRR